MSISLDAGFCIEALEEALARYGKPAIFNSDQGPQSPLWAILAGPIARAIPASWLWPEWIASRSLRMPMWEGGQRMMRAGDAQAFAGVLAGNRLVTANRSALDACAKRAVRTGKPVQCLIAVELARKSGW